MNETQEKIWEALCMHDSETVVRAFTNYYGMQVLDDNFAEFLEDEGILEEDYE